MTGGLSLKPVVVLWSETVMALVVDLLCPGWWLVLMLLPTVLGMLSPAQETQACQTPTHNMCRWHNVLSLQNGSGTMYTW